MNDIEIQATQPPLLDLDCEEFKGYKLNDKEKKLIYFYTLPNQEGYRNAMKAALLAGYSHETARARSYEMIKQPSIKAVIEEFFSNHVKETLTEAYQRVIREKIERAFFDVGNFYETQTIDTGKATYEKPMIKKLESLTPEQRKLISNVSFNAAGIPTYELPDKNKEMDSIVQLYNQMQGITTDTKEYNVNLTISLLKENMQQAREMKEKNSILRESASGYLEEDAELPEYD